MEQKITIATMIAPPERLPARVDESSLLTTTTVDLMTRRHGHARWPRASPPGASSGCWWRPARFAKVPETTHR